MKKENVFKDSNVTLYLVGGHKLDGRIVEISEEEIVLDLGDYDPGTLIARRTMVSGIVIWGERITEGSIDPVSVSTYHESEEEEPLDEEPYYEPEQNTLGQGNHYGSVLPSDMLIGEDPHSVDLSIAMSSLKNAKPKREREDNDSTKKA